MIFFFCAFSADSRLNKTTENHGTITMAESQDVTYHHFLHTIFMNPHIDRHVQSSIKSKLGALENVVPSAPVRKSLHGLYLLTAELLPSIIEKSGKVTISRLNAYFDSSLVDIRSGHWAIQATCETIKDAYIDLIEQRSHHIENQEQVIIEALRARKHRENVGHKPILHSFRRQEMSFSKISSYITIRVKQPPDDR